MQRTLATLAADARRPAAATEPPPAYDYRMALEFE